MFKLKNLFDSFINSFSLKRIFKQYKPWPEKNFCDYCVALQIERTNYRESKDIINQGLLPEPLSLPKLKAKEMQTGDIRFIFNGQDNTDPNSTFVLLYWSKWYKYSIFLPSYAH